MDTPFSAYRVLLVDDEDSVHSFVRDELSDLIDDGSIVLYEAYDQNEAERAFVEHYVDMVLLDLHLEGDDLDGIQVFEALQGLGCSARVVLMTQTHLHQDDVLRLLRLISRSSWPKVVDFIRKNELSSIEAKVRAAVSEHDSGRVELQDLHLGTTIIENRRDRYPEEGPGSLRRDPDEVGVELERLVRDLFGRTEAGVRTTTVAVRLRHLERRGLSAAVLLKPLVHVGFDDVNLSEPGFDCVLKIGPLDGIREEVTRYQGYVRYGVQLEQRVELLATAFRDALGGIVYNFAGGVYGEDLMSLDELLQDDPAASEAALDRLFSTTSWYTLSAGEQLIREYVDTSYKQPVSSAIDRNVKSLEELDDSHPELDLQGGGRDDYVITLRDAGQLRLPTFELFEEGWALARCPWSLIHGDMHGGNVMVELSETTDDNCEKPSTDRTISRVCLIDYRNAGPGPRCIDAVALEASIRLADAYTIMREVDAKASTARSLSEADLRRGMQVALQRSDAEAQLYESLWGQTSQVPSAPWSQQAAQVVKLLQDNTEPEVTLEEYLQTILYYGVRQLGYRMDAIARLRTCAWVSACYEAFRVVNPRPG